MKHMPQHTQPSAGAWDRFFDFITPEDMDSHAAVQADLQRLGLDTRKAFARVKEARDAARARSGLARAAANHDALKVLAGQTVTPSGLGRTELEDIIRTRCARPQQGTLFRRLQEAASDADLASLLADLEVLAKISPGAPDGPDPKAG